MSKFTAEQKIHAVRAYLYGNDSLITVAKRIGLDQPVFSNWVKCNTFGNLVSTLSTAHHVPIAT